jgi:hypothetical protein
LAGVRRKRGRASAATRSLATLARVHSEAAVACLAEIIADGDASHAARVSAATNLLDRAWGRPRQDMGLDMDLAEDLAALIAARRARVAQEK